MQGHLSYSRPDVGSSSDFEAPSTTTTDVLTAVGDLIACIDQVLDIDAGDLPPELQSVKRQTARLARLHVDGHLNRPEMATHAVGELRRFADQLIDVVAESRLQHSDSFSLHRSHGWSL